MTPSITSSPNIRPQSQWLTPTATLSDVCIEDVLSEVCQYVSPASLSNCSKSIEIESRIAKFQSIDFSQYDYNQTSQQDYLNLLAKVGTKVKEITFSKDMNNLFIYRACQLCPYLTAISFNSCNQVSSSMLNYVFRTYPNLEHLDLENVVALTDAMLIRYSEQCSSLQSINLKFLSNVISDAAIIKLIESQKDLRHINLAMRRYCSDQVINAIAANCKNLESIDLHFCRSLSSKSVENLLRETPRLKKINLCSCKQLSRGVIVAMAHNCLELEDINLNFYSNIRKFDFFSLAFMCKNLQRVSIASIMHVDNDTALRLANCPKLKFLNINYCHFVDNNTIDQIGRIRGGSIELLADHRSPFYLSN